MTVLINDSYFQQEVAKSLKLEYNFDSSISYHSDYSLGGIAFKRKSPRVYDAHLYGRSKWISKSLLKQFRDFAFIHLHALVVYGRIRKKNIRSIRMATRFGCVKTNYVSKDFIEVKLTRAEWLAKYQ